MKKPRVAEFLIIFFAITLFAVSSASRIALTPPKQKSVVFVCEKTVESKETGKGGKVAAAFVAAEDEAGFFDSAEQIASLSEFDPREQLTGVKDQGSTNLCWAYSAINASEASLIKSKIGFKDTLNLNPQALAYRKYVRKADDLKNNADYVSGEAGAWQSRAGQIEQTTAILSMWQGPVGEGRYDADVSTNALYRLESANMIYSDLSGEDRIAEIKRAIAEYGAVTASCYYDGGTKQYYNDQSVSNGIAHAITLVGWNDNIDKSLFRPKQAARNGGWLVKNSYSDNGYFYLTYDSKIAATTAWTFTYAPKDTYDYNYYYDNSEVDFGLSKLKQAANVYEAKKGTADKAEYLEAVNVGFVGNDVEVTVKVYTNLTGNQESCVESGVLAAKKTQTFKYGGYNTVKLDKSVKLDVGSYFSIVTEVSDKKGEASIRSVQNAQTEPKKPSFQKTSYGYDYIAYGGRVARIKAYTKVRNAEPICEEHNYGELIPEIPATCSASGTKAHYYCEKCGKYFDENKVEKAKSEFTIAIDADRHDWGEWVSGGNNTHTRVCKNNAEHTEAGDCAGGTSTCTHKAVCEFCHAEYGNFAPHNVVFVPTENATCFSFGRKEHYKCTVCATKFFDEKATQIIADESALVIEKAHKFGEWINEVPATEEKEGVKAHKDCEFCKKHFDENGVEIENITIEKIKKVEIAVVGGTGGGRFAVGETVTVRAKLPEKGQVFAGWQDENGNIVCEDREYTFVVTKKETLTAVYKTENSGDQSSDSPGNSGSSDGSNGKDNSDGSDSPGNPGGASGGKEKPDLTEEIFVGAVVGATTGCFVLVVVFLILRSFLKRSKNKTSD